MPTIISLFGENILVVSLAVAVRHIEYVTIGIIGISYCLNIILQAVGNRWTIFFKTIQFMITQRNWVIRCICYS